MAEGGGLHGRKEGAVREAVVLGSGVGVVVGAVAGWSVVVVGPRLGVAGLGVVGWRWGWEARG